MQSETPAPATASLPPVTPPTGKFIVQLFLVPGLIVGLIVGVLLLVYWLFGGPVLPRPSSRSSMTPTPRSAGVPPTTSPRCCRATSNWPATPTSV